MTNDFIPAQHPRDLNGKFAPKTGTDAGPDALDDGMNTTAEYLALTAERSAIEDERSRLSDRECQINVRLDELLMASRPTYPTPGQRAGIAEAVRRARAGQEASSHRGDPCAPEPDPYEVVAVGTSGFISVRHRSPFSNVRRGSKVWHFTDDEHEALRDLIRDAGATIVSDWPRDDRGISFTIGTDTDGTSTPAP